MSDNPPLVRVGNRAEVHPKYLAVCAERDQLKAENESLRKRLEQTNAYVEALAEMSDGVTNGLRKIRDTM